MSKDLQRSSVIGCMSACTRTDCMQACTVTAHAQARAHSEQRTVVWRRWAVGAGHDAWQERSDWLPSRSRAIGEESGGNGGGVGGVSGGGAPGAASGEAAGSRWVEAAAATVRRASDGLTRTMASRERRIDAASGAVDRREESSATDVETKSVRRPSCWAQIRKQRWMCARTVYHCSFWYVLATRSKNRLAIW